MFSEKHLALKKADQSKTILNSLSDGILVVKTQTLELLFHNHQARSILSGNWLSNWTQAVRKNIFFNDHFEQRIETFQDDANNEVLSKSLISISDIVLDKNFVHSELKMRTLVDRSTTRFEELFITKHYFIFDDVECAYIVIRKQQPKNPFNLTEAGPKESSIIQLVPLINQI